MCELWQKLQPWISDGRETRKVGRSFPNHPSAATFDRQRGHLRFR